jgi:hypothetical protein
MQEVAQLYLGHNHRGFQKYVPLSFAETKYQKLLAWSTSIASSMAVNSDSPAHVVIFQQVNIRQSLVAEY